MRSEDVVHIKFTPIEQDLILMASAARQLGKSNNAKNFRIDMTRDDFQIHRIGLMGEAAFAKYYGFNIDTRILAGGDAGFDFILPSGLTVDIKVGQRDLILNTIHHFKSDIIFLIQYKKKNFKEVWLAGWTDLDLFALSCKEKNFGYGNRLYMPYTCLNSIYNFHY